MIFRKTDDLFKQAAISSDARDALIARYKKARKRSIIACFVGGVMLLLLFVNILVSINAVAKGVREAVIPDFELLIPDFEIYLYLGIAATLVVSNIAAAADADSRVKMLILFDAQDAK